MQTDTVSYNTNKGKILSRNLYIFKVHILYETDIIIACNINYYDHTIKVLFGLNLQLDMH